MKNIALQHRKTLREPDNRADAIQRDPQFRAIRRAIWQKWRTLANDKAFIWETAKLKLNLKAAFKSHPKDVQLFFDPLFEPRLYPANEITKRIKKLSDKHLQNTLRAYTRYVLRFGVAMQLHKRAPHFRTRGTGADADPSTKFHVKVTGSHFKPTESWWDDGNTSISDYFGSETVPVGPEMQKLIDTGVAKYVEIEDLQKRSLLNRLMDFAYSPDRLTFVLLASEQPYLLCLIGENVSVEKTWRDASKVVSEFQKRQYSRTRAGRPPQLRELTKQLAVLLRQDLTPKQLAHRFAQSDTEKGIFSKWSSLSQIKGKLKM